MEEFKYLQAPLKVTLDKAEGQLTIKVRCMDDFSSFLIWLV